MGFIVVIFHITGVWAIEVNADVNISIHINGGGDNMLFALRK